MSGRTDEQVEVNNIYFVSPTEPSAHAVNALGRRCFCIRAPLSISLQGLVHISISELISRRGKKKQMAKKREKRKPCQYWWGEGSDNKKEPLALIFTIRGKDDLLCSSVSRNACAADCVSRFSKWCGGCTQNQPEQTHQKKANTEALKASPFGSSNELQAKRLVRGSDGQRRSRQKSAGTMESEDDALLQCEGRKPRVDQPQLTKLWVAHKREGSHRWTVQPRRQNKKLKWGWNFHFLSSQ